MFPAKFLSKTVFGGDCSGALMTTGPTETTTFGSVVLWSTASTSLSTHRHTNIVRFKCVLLLNSADYKFMSYFF